jgi:hypothetical protein
VKDFGSGAICEDSTMLNQDFFESELRPLVAEYAQHREIMNADDIRIEMTVRSSAAPIAITGYRTSADWVVVFTEADEMLFLPYHEITSLTVEHRKSSHSRKKPPTGFSIPTESP